MLPAFTLSTKRDRRRYPILAAGKHRRVRTLEAISLWLAMLMLLLVQPFYAEAAMPPHDEGEGTGAFYLISPQGDYETPATLLTTDYQVTVSGLIATTRLEQRFENTSQQWREGVFVFPLPDGASVYGLTMKAGERVVVGEIREREQAEKQYQIAKAQGRQVARVDQQRPDLFTTRLANIPPGETVTVELHYQQAVGYQSGEFELRLPTTLTPRYMPGRPVTPAAERSEDWQAGWATPTTAVPDAGEISPFTVRPEDVGAGSHRATVRLSLSAGLPIASVTSSSHRLTSTWNGDVVTVAPESDHIVMDRDVIVRWSPTRGQAPSAAVFHQQWQGEDYLLTLLVPGLESGHYLSRELIFVIDTSGSMGGEPIRQARASLLQGLETLAEGDRFNVIEFNSQPHSLFMEAQPVSAANLARARRYVTALNAGGGTEMSAALTAALTRPPAAADAAVEYVRQVVFITDGAVGNEQALFHQIQQQLGHSRLFTVGIGSAPNMHFMREAARYGRGTFTAINDMNSMTTPLNELFHKMQAPVMVDIHHHWPTASTADAFPKRSGDLFIGEPLVQVARGQPAQGTLTVSGRLPDGGRWQDEIELSKAAAGVGLHRYWAQQKINNLQDQGFSGEPGAVNKAAIVNLGLQHELVTPYTSFIAVDKTPVRSANEPTTTDAVPTLLPAGSTAQMLQYPQTATWSPLLLTLGLLGLMFSAVALMVRRGVLA